MICGNAMQHNPNGIVSPPLYDDQPNTIWSFRHQMVTQTPYRQSHTVWYGRYNGGHVNQHHQHVNMDPTNGRETAQFYPSFSRGEYNSRLPAIQNNDTVGRNMPRRITPYIEEYSDDTVTENTFLQYYIFYIHVAMVTHLIKYCEVFRYTVNILFRQ